MSNLPVTPAAQSPTSSPSVPPSGPGFRRERGSIAAQACDTCRSRKQRCDEQRPKCGTCQRFRLECNYREPQPTKKDKTLVEILDRIKSVEVKLDNLNLRSLVSSSATRNAQLQAGPLAAHPLTPFSGTPGLSVGSQQHVTPFPLAGPSGTSLGNEAHYKYVSSILGTLSWPAMQQFFASLQPKMPNTDLRTLEKDCLGNMLGFDRTGIHGLPISSFAGTIGQGTSINMQATGPVPITVSGLNWETMENLANAYFDTFNLMYPILDRHPFFTETLPSLFNNGLTHSTESTIALLVFALGELALLGSDGPPVHVYSGRPSGVKGSSKNRPPGLELFNEARKRMGFNATECSLENIQMFSLASTYYGSCFFPMDLWRMTTFASSACQALVASKPDELSSSRADLLRRVFWACSITETCVHLELDFPLTGLDKLENLVGLPKFSNPLSDSDHIANQESQFQEHFASEIVWRRLLVDFHRTLSRDNPAMESIGPMPTPFTPGPLSAGVNPGTIHQLALQLEQWRGMLPPGLGWDEDSPGSFPHTTTVPFDNTLYTPTDPAMSPTIPATPRSNAPVPPSVPLMFTTDLDAPPVHYRFGRDIQVALLRSRYYYTKYLLYRPFLYKALHFPDAMTDDDAMGVAKCLRSMLKWPVAMSPTCKNKRHVPCLFFFTQNFFGMLLFLHLSTQVPILQRIRSSLCGDRFEMEANETVGLYLDWLRDLRPIDIGVEWHWELIKAVYGLDG